MVLHNYPKKKLFHDKASNCTHAPMRMMRNLDLEEHLWCGAGPVAWWSAMLPAGGSTLAPHRLHLIDSGVVPV
jgi:hypothetical protein